MANTRFTLGSEEYVVLSAGAAKRAISELTPAEQRVLALVLDARSNREIAAARGTSERTVANQLASIFRKTGARSRSELVAQRR